MGLEVSLTTSCFEENDWLERRPKGVLMRNVAGPTKNGNELTRNADG